MHYAFTDIFDIPTLTRLCEKFMPINRIAIALLDLEGNVHIATGWQDICTRFHRANPNTAQRCTESDIFLSAQLNEGEQYNVYQCKNGLIDIAVPIFVKGEHIANFFTGQFFTDKPDIEFFCQQAHENGFDQQDYLNALKKVPIFDREHIDKITTFLVELSQIIGEMGLTKLTMLENQQNEKSRLEQLVSKRTHELNEAQQLAALGSWTLDLVDNELHWSDEIYRIFEFDKNSFTPSYEAFIEAVHPEDRDKVNQAYHNSVNNRQKYEIYHRILLKDGKIKYVKERGITEYDNKGKPLLSRGTVQDISSIQNRIDQIKVMLDSASDGVHIMDLNGNVIECSQSFADYLGYSKEEALLLNIKDWDIVVAKEDVTSILQDYVEKKLVRTFRTRHKRKDGSIFDAEIHARAIQMTGKNYIYASTRDVTERIKDRNKIKEERNRAQQYLDIASVILVALDKDGCISMINSKGCEVLEASEKELLGKNWFDNFLLSDDINKVKTVFSQLINHKIELNRYFENEIKTALGKVKTISWHNASITNNNGEITGILSSGLDITEQKQAQLLLEAESERYKSIISATQDGYWQIDRNGKIRDVNDAYCKLSGYSRDELLAMSVWHLEAKENKEQVLNHLRQVTVEKNEIFESWHRGKKGELWPVEISLSFVPIGEGFIVAFLRNILERKIKDSIVTLKQELGEILYSGNYQQLMQRALDIAESMTQSQIGFFHYVEEVQEVVTLQVWSSNTLSGMCSVEGQGVYYPISEAGIWVDCVRQGKPVIHNEYTSQENKNGLPEGYAPLLRVLTVPVMLDDKLIAVMGVGNKQSEYSENDIQIVQQVADLAMQYVQRITLKEKVERAANYDELTNTPNRALLQDRLYQAIANADRNKSLLAVCYLDLDGFKPINDRYGHDIGDKLLQKLSSFISKDLRDGDTIARLGGDEFVLLLANLKEFYECEDILQRVLSLINTPLEIDQHRIHITGSIGLTIYPVDDADPDTLLRHADQAMLKVKNEGKASFKLYDAVQNESLREHRQVMHEFEIALHSEQLELYYQPKINLSNANVSGVEALIRWNHPHRGTLTPWHFLPIIENTSLEIALGEWVVKTALKQLHIWRKQGFSFTVSVNISPRHIQMENFAVYLQEALSQYPDDLVRFVELEVLETANIEDIDKVANVMSQCVNLGVKFSLDDFGTGYSSLTYFHRLPISILKIDQNFVKDILDDSDDLDIVEGVIKLAKTLERPVIAEGVESIELGMMLLQLGCDSAQGYGIARPMKASQLLGWIDSWGDNFVWHQLNRSYNYSLMYYDIHVAVFSHNLWYDSIKQMALEGKSPLTKMDEYKCQFSRWYKGIGKRRYGQSSGYPFIKPKHSFIHTQSDKLIKLVEKNKMEQAQQLLKELDVASKELTQMLTKLKR